MRFTSFAITLVILLFSFTSLAQDAEYPTLDAWAELEIPAYSVAEYEQRFNGVDIFITAPSSPPAYALGDLEPYTVNLAGTWESLPFELRGMTENVLIWVQETSPYPRDKAQALAQRLETEAVEWYREFLDYEPAPGVDGDPRLFVLMAQRPHSLAFFLVRDREPQTVNPNSNERELILAHIADYDGSDAWDTSLFRLIASRYQQILLSLRDEGEEGWLVFGLNAFFEHFLGGGWIANRQFAEFLQAPRTGLTALRYPCCVPQIGGAGLFLIYAAEQYGDEVIAGIHAESADGWRSIDKVLQEYAGVSANEVFADWVLSNYYFDADRGFGYKELEPELPKPEPVAKLRSFPAAHSGSLWQLSTDYLTVDVRGADALSLLLTQAPEARLVDAAPYEGDHFYYAVTVDGSNSRLTRAIDLTEADNASLDFKIRHDLDEDQREYAHIAVSTDGGETWDVLKGSHTTDKARDDSSVSDRYSLTSDGWLEESISLNDYTGGEILIRFETISPIFSSNYRGMAIDDLRIDAIGFHDGFEAPDDTWIAEGWLRTDNRLPNNTWLQVVQETDSGLELTRSLMTGPGEVTVDLLPGVESALIAISPIAPLAGIQTEYSLAVNQLDADGNVIVVDRDCQVTTTTGLNFRDAPNGEKIGLLPNGTTVDALDSRDGWFNVEYDGLNGWIHGDYVTKEGNCG